MSQIILRIMFRRLFIIFLILQISCSKEIEIDLDNTKALVLNSIFNPDSLFTFHITATASLLNNYDTLSENLHFSLYDEDKLIFESVSQSGLFKTNLKPVSGRKYTVELQSSNFPALKAIDAIPNLVPIDNAYMIFPSGVDAFGFYIAEACVSFTDPPNETNYYELIISSKPGGANAWNSEYETNDPVLQNEGDQDYHPTSFFFSDELFNGEPYEMRIKHGTGYSLKDNKLTAFPLYATLRSVSMNYYKYRKFYTRHAYNQQFQNEFLDLIFKGEPQNMFTNIENGYGIFAGYCESTTQMIQNE
jgi:hypothetical protein